ncbi:flagellar biosynthetic protein FliR [Propionivibrio limicola]|uniref:flagellar biosynthetic protein FliR n=1 Tax=Propionivibrio limicola TaxID=167645 RepID=UPI0012915E1D|nr:flagellar biosynthetic protein FliR [Propionivibrio limicola]
MISLSSTELNAWLAAYFFPLARILALLAAAPPFYYTALPRRVRLMLGLAITIAIVPALGTPFPAPPSSGQGLLILAEQLLIGFAMGFSMRLAFSAIDLAGNIISFQMGLGFATSYDPSNASQTPVISELIAVLGLLLFLAIDGHLMVISTLVQSFRALPVGTLPGRDSWMNIAQAGGIIFSSGLLLTLPIIVALLITNTALGVLGRVAPQLNLIVIGFPITITLGFTTLYVTLPYLNVPLMRLFETGLQAMLGNFVLK